MKQLNHLSRNTNFSQKIQSGIKRPLSCSKEILEVSSARDNNWNIRQRFRKKPLRPSPGRAVQMLSQMYPSPGRERSEGTVSLCPPHSIGQSGPYVPCVPETAATGGRSAAQNCGRESGKGRKGLKRPKSKAFILYSICLFASEKGTGVGNYDGVFKFY